MSSQWYAKVMGETFGPLSVKELREMAENKILSQDDLVRQGESEHWVYAERVKGLFSDASKNHPTESPVPPKVEEQKPTPNMSAKPAQGFQIIHGNTTCAYRSIGRITAKVGAATLLSRAPTIEEVNLKLQEEALKVGANAVINVEYDRSFSMSSWKPLRAQGLAVLLFSDEVPCPACAESVKVSAKKCRYCGEVLPISVDAWRDSVTQLNVPQVQPASRNTLWEQAQYAIGCCLGIWAVLFGISTESFGILLKGLIVSLVVIPYSWDSLYAWSGMNSEHSTRNRWLVFIILLVIPTAPGG